MNFTWQEMVFVFVSGILLVLIPSIIFTRRARAEKKAKTENDNAFTTIIEWLDRMELSGVSLLSKLVVLFAPVPVAVQTKGHAKTYLGIEGIGGWILAFVVEALGYAAAYRLLQFIQYNKNLEAQRQAKIVNLQGVEKKRALEKLAIARKKSNAPVTGPAIVYGFYILTVIGFNVLPEVFGKQSEWWKVLMWVFIALLSIPAAYLGAINAIHTEQKEANKRPRTNTPAEQPAQQVNTRTPEHRTPEHRTPEHSNARTLAHSNTRTPTPQPAANERRTFTPYPNTEHKQRIEQTANALQANGIKPSVRNIQRALRIQDFESVNHRVPSQDEERTLTGWSVSTISKALNRKE